MRVPILCILALIASSIGSPVASAAESTPRMSMEQANAQIDMDGFLRVSAEAAAHRSTHRVPEADFIRMSGEDGTLVLDARSTEKYAELHVKGAVNLSFPDIAVDSLQKAIPDKTTRVLIYCNNNFRNAAGPFPTKLPSASLNLSTYIALYNYGYRNVYELADTLDPATSKLVFEGSAAVPAAGVAAPAPVASAEASLAPVVDAGTDAQAH